ncbi:MAG: CcmD family protein [Firmicutes bacterium]|nr:CcmD family protein [Bacillota bacterium]
MLYMFVAYTVVWLFIAGYTLWMGRQQRKLAREVEELTDELEERR